MWVLLQIAVNIFLILGGFIIWSRMKRPPQDDPRLSRGLQLLQSKISVLEDLSDRTETQVNQLNSLMDQKSRQVQKKLLEASQKIQEIEQCMQKSSDVAEIFQDKIPHREIIERQNSIKYIKAARMAHGGSSVDEISQEVDLPRGEIEFIAKVNKEELMFDDDALPEWAKAHMSKLSSESENSEVNQEFQELEDEVEFLETAKMDTTMGPAFDNPAPEYTSLKKLGEEFRQACVDFDKKQTEPQPPPVLQSIQKESGEIIKSAKDFTNKVIHKASDILSEHQLKFAEDQEPGVSPEKEPTFSNSKAVKILPSSEKKAAQSKVNTSLRRESPVVQPGDPTKVIRKVQFPNIDMSDDLE